VIAKDPAAPDSGWFAWAVILILAGVVLELAPLIEGLRQAADE
jgi:hypothetical protein